MHRFTQLYIDSFAVKGNLLIQANWKTTLFDYKANGFTGVEDRLPDIPAAVR